MLIALSAKNKMRFIDGSFPKPSLRVITMHVFIVMTWLFHGFSILFPRRSIIL
jgi:hypothetical protein